MNTNASFSMAPSHPSMLETFLGLALVTLLSAGAWSLFSSLPAYGGQSTPPPTVQFAVPAPAPMCFNLTREQVQAQGAEPGCPTDPMSYRPATLHQVNI
ncbi:MAG: hypothetical protein RSP_18040 [Rhodanobacter sp.]